MNKENKDRFYYNSKFLGSPGARSVRILSEYYGPLQRFERNNIQDFLVFFGSARIKSEKEAKDAVALEINQARQDAAKLIEKTNKELETQKDLALQQLETQVDELSQLIKEKLLGKEVVL